MVVRNGELQANWVTPGVHGNDEAKVYAELCQTVEEVIEILETDGYPLPESLGLKKFSGKFVLRVEPALHRRLAAKAIATGESLNSFCLKSRCEFIKGGNLVSQREKNFDARLVMRDWLPRTSHDYEEII